MMGKGLNSLAPPYGPTRGMLEALELMRRVTPPKIDSGFLRANNIAPGNEYKVVGALRYLGLIDDDGQTTERSRLLKTKGATYTQAMQQIVRSSYQGLFQRLQGQEATQDSIYNYFVTEGGLGAEMASKATRFFIGLCRLAGIELGSELTPPPEKGEHQPRRNYNRRPRAEPVAHQDSTEAITFPLVLALTPEIAEMEQGRLTELLRKLRIALRESMSEED